jgi:predicted DNA-binding protein with PD1-like motif
MKTKLLNNLSGRREWIVVFDAGDEVMAGLKQFAADERLEAAHFTGIGAMASVTTGWFNLEKQRYEPTDINEQVELLSLIGDVAASPGGKPAVHAHLTVGKRDGTAHGGHLMKGIVRPTLELTIAEAPAHLRKTLRPEFGIALLDLSK